MTTSLDIRQLHPYVEAGIDSWYFYKHAYEGTRSLIRNENVLPRHSRETKENYARRLAAAYGFGYSSAVVDLLTFYLFQQPAVEEWGGLADNELFNMFLADSDLYGTDLDVFLVEAQKAAAIQGHSGVLVDKPSIQEPTGEGSVVNEVQVISQADAENNEIYPYVSLYEATNILNWSYQRDSYGRPFLSYLVLLDTVEEDGVYRYRVWTTETWEVWVSSQAPYRAQDNIITSTSTGRNQTVNTELEAQGTNDIGVIPFTWILNSKSSYRNIGISDLKEVSHIDASIIRNLSQSEEITDYAAFPMLMKPLLPPGQEEDDTVGVTSIVEFDPDRPESMPRWMESKVKEPIDAILTVISKKIEEIYRAVNAGGLNATETSTQVKSGVALAQEFRLLNAKLASKSAFLEEAQKSIIKYWMEWEEIDAESQDIMIKRPREFNISDLLTDLESVVMSVGIVNSDTYDRSVQKIVARRTLPEHDDFEEIDKEIDEHESPEINIPPGFDADAANNGTQPGDQQQQPPPNDTTQAA